jgi:hypothetical protein
VTAVVVDVAVAGKNGRPPPGSTDSTEQMLKLGVVSCVAMLILAKWLITGAAVALTDPTVHGSGILAPGAAVAVLRGYAAVLLAVAIPLVIRRDIA